MTEVLTPYEIDQLLRALNGEAPSQSQTNKQSSSGLSREEIDQLLWAVNNDEPPEREQSAAFKAYKQGKLKASDGALSQDEIDALLAGVGAYSGKN
jgi:flagellar motor switch protein FliM